MHKIYAAKSMFAAPSITLESDESVNGAATDRGRGGRGRTDDVSIQRSWFDSIVIDGVEQNLIRIPDRVRERQGERGGRPPRWAFHVPARRRTANVIMHRQAESAPAPWQGREGYLAACFTTTHAARRGALPVGGIG